MPLTQAQLGFLESEREALAGNAQKAFGRKLRVVLGAGEPDEADETTKTKPRPTRPTPPVNAAPETKPAPPAAASAKPPGKSALKSRAMADPVVGRTLDLFGGTLLDVKPLAVEPETKDEADRE